MRYKLYEVTDTSASIVTSANYRNEIEAIKHSFEESGKHYEIVEDISLMDLSQIRISKSFKSRHPKASKLSKYRELYNSNGLKLLEQNPIVINSADNFLLDGYCSYIVLKESGYTGNIPVSLWESEHKYRLVYALHKNNSKPYHWICTESKYRNVNGINPGDKIVVRTRYGKQVVTVIGIEQVEFTDKRLKDIKRVVAKVVDING